MKRTLVAALSDVDDADFATAGVQHLYYAALRREQAAFVARVTAGGGTNEARWILSLARSAERELAATLAGRDAATLDERRDGEWTLRDLLRHALAVEVRYRAQVIWSATRSDDDPIPIPVERLPCDRLAPPDETFGASRSADVEVIIGLLSRARDDTDRALCDLSAAALPRPSRWGSNDVDVRERMHQIAAHLIEVVVQTEKMLGSHETEARRITRRVQAMRGLHEDQSGPAICAELDDSLRVIAARIRGGPDAAD